MHVRKNTHTCKQVYTYYRLLLMICVNVFCDSTYAGFIYEEAIAMLLENIKTVSYCTPHSLKRGSVLLEAMPVRCVALTFSLHMTIMPACKPDFRKQDLLQGIYWCCFLTVYSLVARQPRLGIRAAKDTVEEDSRGGVRVLWLHTQWVGTITPATSTTLLLQCHSTYMY